MTIDNRHPESSAITRASFWCSLDQLLAAHHYALCGLLQRVADHDRDAGNVMLALVDGNARIRRRAAERSRQASAP